MSAVEDGPVLSDRDFEAIEAAVMETERGRWFLAEYDRRHRAADTQILLDALKKLEAAIVPLKPEAAAPNDLFAQDEHLFTPPPEPPPPPKPQVLKLEPAAAPPAPEKKRVVIIRRTASENVDIPLADAMAG